MSSIDYNNGLIVGLALRGLPYKAKGEDFVESIVNISETETLITFTTGIEDVDLEHNIYSFYVMAKYYWIMETYPINSVLKTATNQIKLTHVDFSDCDGIITIGYNGKTGSIRTLSGIDLGSFFYSFTGVFALLKIRLRESLPVSAMTVSQVWPSVSILALTETPSMDIRIPTSCAASEMLRNEMYVDLTPPNIALAITGENHTEELYIP